MEPTYFATPAAFRTWLMKHHASVDVLLVGFFKKGSGTPSITWPESVDEALSFGWIDGVRKRVDDERYTIRFTPRRKRSIWSDVNIARVEVLEREGKMTDAGRRAFEARVEARSGVYAYEQRDQELSGEYLKTLKKNAAAWKAWQSRTPSFRRTHSWWVISAKQEGTRARRLEKLVESLLKPE